MLSFKLYFKILNNIIKVCCTEEGLLLFLESVSGGATNPSWMLVLPWSRMYFSWASTVHFWLCWLLLPVSPGAPPWNIKKIYVVKLKKIIMVIWTECYWTHAVSLLFDCTQLLKTYLSLIIKLNYIYCMVYLMR